MLKDLTCKNAKGKAKPYKLSDSHGLYLDVLPTGTRVWRWDYRFDGKAQTITFGRYPALSLSDARLERAALDKIRRSGVDPRTARQRARGARADAEAATFESVARHWHTQWRSTWSAVHATNIMKGLEREIFPHIGHLPIAQMKPRTILEALKPIEQRGAVERVQVERLEENGLAMLERPEGEVSPYKSSIPMSPSLAARLPPDPKDTYWVEYALPGPQAKRLAQDAGLMVEGTIAALADGKLSYCEGTYIGAKIDNPLEIYGSECWIGARVSRIAFIRMSTGEVLKEWGASSQAAP